MVSQKIKKQEVGSDSKEKEYIAIRQLIIEQFPNFQEEEPHQIISHLSEHLEKLETKLQSVRSLVELNEEYQLLIR